MPEYGSSIDWKSIYLGENPFTLEPPINPQSVTWAGMSKLHQNLDRVLREGLCSSRTQVVLNRGVIGGGKTHAAIYYAIPDRLPKADGACVAQTWSIRVQLPKEPADAVGQFYRQIVEQFTLSQIRKNFNEIVANTNQDSFLKAFHETVGSEDLALALWKLGKSTDADEQAILNRYFLTSRYTPTDLKKLGVARGIDSLLDRTAVLAAIIRSFIGMDPSTEPSKHNRVIIWIDEMEDLVYYAAREHRPFTQALRDLIDHIPNFLTLFMNFTMTRPEREEEINAILGGYIERRITDKVSFDELNRDEMNEYITDLLTSYRTKEMPPKLPRCYPFDNAGLEEIGNILKIKAPGYINRICYKLIEVAFAEKKLPSPTFVINAIFIKEHAESLRQAMDGNGQS